MGCGWLGFPLALDLLKSRYHVKGTTTCLSKLKKLKKAGINPYIIKVHEDKIEGTIQDFLLGIDILIINIPPRLRGNKNSNYVKKMELLLSQIKKTNLKYILFVSSTSVYGDLEGTVTEGSIPKPETESGKQLLMCEQLFKNQKNLNTTIIRFGGLIGGKRHPINQLSGKKGLQNGEALVNLIHLEDCIHMIKTILQNNYWNALFNGVYPEHPTKKEYYTLEAFKRGLAPPEFIFPLTAITKKSIISKNFLNNFNFLYTTIFS